MLGFISNVKLRIMNSKRICWVFAGQGSQYLGMGKLLYANNAVFKNYMEEGSSVVEHQTGYNLCEILYHQSSAIKDFDDLLITHPAVVLIQIALANTLMAEGLNCDYVWGNSIGELAAAVIAGAIDMDTALRLSIDQANAIISHVVPGAMLAVMADPEIYKQSPGLQSCEWAGQSFKGHFTLSGSNEQINTAIAFLKKERIFHQKIAVSYPFHSTHINSAMNSFFEKAELIQFKAFKKQMCSSAHVSFLESLNAQKCWQAVREPIQFQNSYEFLASKVDLFVDLSPSASMATLLKYNQQYSDVKFISTLNAYQKDISWLDKVKQAYFSVGQA